MKQLSLPLILASRSPRRCELLREAGYRFEIVFPDEAAESAVVDTNDPADFALQAARLKVDDVARQMRKMIHEGHEERRNEGKMILGCDTVVECGGEMLGKPRDVEDARRILYLLRGREHRVFSGICLLCVPHGEPLSDVAETRLRMDSLSDRAVKDYLAGGQWRGKAGAFGYQDRLEWVRILEGSASNVVGLPLELLAEMLKRVE
jgi:septum formation protein